MDQDRKYSGRQFFRGRGMGEPKNIPRGSNHINDNNSQGSSWGSSENEYSNIIFDDYDYNKFEEQYNSCETFDSGCNDAEYNYENYDNNDYESQEGNYNQYVDNEIIERGDNNKNNGEERELPKKVEFYIPPELSNEESDVFSSGITTGINFEKLDNIEVEMNGDNLPNIISSFEDINLTPILMNNIRRSTYTKPTPIQKYALSIVNEGRDLIACAQTGSGKTAAFLLPIINNLLKHPTDLVVDGSHVEPQAVIVSPTRELAMQIHDDARKFSFDSDIKVSLVYGGVSCGYQRKSIARGCHILIATPGRLLDFVNRGWITFSSIRFVVLDEADRMLNMGFLPPMEEMFEHPTMIPTGERITLMFSATFPQELQTLAARFLQDYIFVVVGVIGSASLDVEQTFLQVGQSEKRHRLLEILQTHETNGTLIFVETKRNANFLAIYLSEQNFKINSIHGDRTQREREEAIRDFKSGNCDILVATSVAARGLDIPNVRHVINFDLPVSKTEEYIHRIGRTGRIGNKGMATSFFDDNLNSRKAEAYVKILEQAEQNVPDWLRSAAGNNNYNYSKPSFGGRDRREEQQPEENNWF